MIPPTGLKIEKKTIGPRRFLPAFAGIIVIYIRGMSVILNKPAIRGPLKLLILVLTGAFFAASANGQAKMTTVAEGNWAGTDAHLIVTRTEVTIDFGCAQGSIPVRLKIDKNGAFRVEGTYKRRTPGPIRIGFAPKPQPAIFYGVIKGRKMTLNVEIKNSAEAAQAFNLIKGKIGDELKRCY